MKKSLASCIVVLLSLTAAAVGADEKPQITAEKTKEVYGKAIEAFNNRKYEESLELIRSVISGKHSNYELRYLAAHNHWKLNNLSAAAAHLQNVVRQKPETSGAYIDLALVQIQARKLKAARKTILDGIENLQDAEKDVPAKMFSILSRTELMSKKYKSALAYAQKAKAAETKKEDIKDKVETLILEGRAQLALGNFDQAELALSWAVSLKNNDAWLENLLGYIYEKRAARNGKEFLLKAEAQYLKARDLNSQPAIKSTIEKNLQRVQKKLKEA